jgi:hypothetical protein
VIEKLYFNLPYGQKEPVTTQKPASGGTTTENKPAPDGPSYQRKSGLKHPELTPPKAVQYGGAASIATQPSLSTLRRDRDLEKGSASM